MMHWLVMPRGIGAPAAGLVGPKAEEPLQPKITLALLNCFVICV